MAVEVDGMGGLLELGLEAVEPEEPVEPVEGPAPVLDLAVLDSGPVSSSFLLRGAINMSSLSHLIKIKEETHARQSSLLLMGLLVSRSESCS